MLFQFCPQLFNFPVIEIKRNVLVMPLIYCVDADCYSEQFLIFPLVNSFGRDLMYP